MSIEESELINFEDLPVKDQAVINAVLRYWFNHAEEVQDPTAKQAALWFNPSADLDVMIRQRFESNIEAAAIGEYDHWQKCLLGQLALILLLDQFPRYAYRGDPRSLEHDQKALDICIHGAANEQEHALSLIERAFYYAPLLHAEDLVIAEQAVYAYQLLAQYALEETQPLYQKFLDQAESQYKMLDLFGRFPMRNALLGRESSNEEKAFLAMLDNHSTH